MTTEQPGDTVNLDESTALAAARTGRADLHYYMGQLEHAVSAPVAGKPSDWVKHVHDTLVELGGSFERHIAITEGPGGLFEEVHSAAPRLAHGVNQLAADHREIREAIARALDAIRDRTDVVPLEAQADGREAVLEVLKLLMRHRQLGADLIYEAYQVDVGVGD